MWACNIGFVIARDPVKIVFLLLTRVITILTFYCLVKNNNLVITILTFLLVKIVKNNNYVITVLTLLLSVNFHVLVLII